jgi:hypothetical protein
MIGAAITGFFTERTAGVLRRVRAATFWYDAWRTVAARRTGLRVRSAVVVRRRWRVVAVALKPTIANR